MKKYEIFLIFFSLFISNVLWSQTNYPSKFNFSATALNKSGKPIKSSTIGVQLSILKKSSTGTPVYTENHYVNTDELGQFSVIIGEGSATIGKINSIKWIKDNYKYFEELLYKILFFDKFLEQLGIKDKVKLFEFIPVSSVKYIILH